VHSHFYQQLCKAVSKERPVTVGECFLTCKEKFIIHGDYCSNLLDAQNLVDKLSANSPSFMTRLTASQIAHCLYVILMRKKLFSLKHSVCVIHASKTAKINVFDPVICKTPDAPLQDELLC